MDRYYYLVSTLQTPVFGQKPPIPFEELERILDRLADDSDKRAFARLSVAPPGDDGAGKREGGHDGVPPLLESFWRRERALRGELARLRSERLGRTIDAQGGEEWDGEAQASAKRAMAAEDPLQAELSLEKDRWDWIEARTAGHRFDADALAAYGLKILILERLGRFGEETGMERYESMYRTILSGSDTLAAYGDESWTGNGEAAHGPN